MRSSFVFAALSSFVSFAAGNCIYGTHLHRREEGQVPISNFGYSGTTGPVNWAGIAAENSACATSTVQSPIVLDDTVSFASEAPVVSIANVEEAEFENLGSTVEVVVNGTTTFAGTEFSLKQFHLHTPSEHRINEEYFPLEMHMVHEAADGSGSIAVIAVPFQLTEDGSTTELLTSVIQNLGDIESPGTATTTGPLNFESLINNIQTTPLFQYTGSLTTPPCAEGLTFLVVSEPLALNVATYNAIKRVVKFNARNVQNNLGDTNILQLANDVQQKAQLNTTCAIEAVDNQAAASQATHEQTSSTEAISTAAHETTITAAPSASPSYHFQTSTTTILTPEQACSVFGICSAKFGHHQRRGLFDFF